MPSRSGRPEEGSSPRSLPERLEVGRIGRPHGIRGEVRVEVLTDVPGRFDRGSHLMLCRSGYTPRWVQIAESRPHGGAALVRFAGIEQRDQAEELRGAILEVDRATVPAAPPGTYYHFELVGCRCVDRGEGDLGEVVNLVEDGGGLLLDVRGRRQSVLVPFVEAFLERVDTEAGRIDLNLPPGFLAACASRS